MRLFVSLSADGQNECLRLPEDALYAHLIVQILLSQLQQIYVYCPQKIPNDSLEKVNSFKDDDH